MAQISEENPIKMGCLYSCLICVAPVIGTAALSVHWVYASPDGSTKWSDLADRVILPCPVFTVAVQMAPSSIGTISPTLGSCCVVPLSTGVQSGEIFLSPPVPQLRCEVLLISPSADQVLDPRLSSCTGLFQFRC
ncbi:hypothetical protein T07_14431 [Trichinella nelsoni]|uniref:Uncharacterized protein n=1 Tax=Trichinella nelsoni TaxID=6336 RepID=A0A0V0RSD7_9BILA|nr:hypothetical protein T07_14431 [Trichinella nelsoni]